MIVEYSLGEKSAKEKSVALPPQEKVVNASNCHLDYLDGMRALAALAVVWCHCLLPNWGDWPLGFAITSKLRLFSLYDNLGHFAVNLFIVLSGFCLMMPVIRRRGIKGGALGFFKRRAIRILPPYYCATAISLILIATLIGHKTGTPWDASLPVGEMDILRNLFLLQNFSSHPGSINHAHWSISLEWWIYFLFPVFVFVWRKAGSVTLGIGAFLFSVSLICGGEYFFGRSFTLQYIALFALGMCGASIVYSSDPKERMGGAFLGDPGVFSVLTLAVLGLSRYGISAFGNFWGPVVADCVVGLWSVSLLAMLAIGRAKTLKKCLSLRPLVFVGTFAYSIYLIHAPLVHLLWEYGLAPLELSPLSTYVQFKIVAIPLVLVGSYGFHLVCERPFLSKNQKTSTQDEAYPENADTRSSIRL